MASGQAELLEEHLSDLQESADMHVQQNTDSLYRVNQQLSSLQQSVNAQTQQNSILLNKLGQQQSTIIESLGKGNGKGNNDGGGTSGSCTCCENCLEGVVTCNCCESEDCSYYLGPLYGLFPEGTDVTLIEPIFRRGMEQNELLGSPQPVVNSNGIVENMYPTEAFSGGGDDRCESSESAFQYQYSIASGQALNTGNNGNNRNRGPPANPPDDFEIDADGDDRPDIAIVHMREEDLIPATADNFWDIIPGTRITFTPTINPDEYDVVTTFHGDSLDHIGGTNLTLSDGGSWIPRDGWDQLAMGHTFPFQGLVHSEVFVQSDGGVNFVTAESLGCSIGRTALSFMEGSMGLAPLWSNHGDIRCAALIQPEGAVQFFTDGSKTVVTWLNMPHDDSEGFCVPEIGAISTSPKRSTFQVVMFPDGSFQFNYGDIDTDTIGSPTSLFGQTGIVVTAGSLTGISLAQPVQLVDFSQLTTTGTFVVGNIFEAFEDGQPERLDLFKVPQRFYQTWPDHYDQLVIYTAGFEAAQGAIKVGSNVKVPRDALECCLSAGFSSSSVGLGQNEFDGSAVLGSAGEVENVISMGSLESRGSDPTFPHVSKFRNMLPSQQFTDVETRLGPFVTPVNTFTGIFFDMLMEGEPAASSPYFHIRRDWRRGVQLSGVFASEMSVLTQEVMHRWASFPGFSHPNITRRGTASFRDLLGRDRAHWSFFMDTSTRIFDEDGGQRYDVLDGQSIVHLIRDPNDPNKIVDAFNHSSVFEDTKGQNIARFLSFCAFADRELFTSRPFALSDGIHELTQLLAGMRTVDDVPPMWYVDSPHAIRAPLFGLEISLEEFRGERLVVQQQNYAYCGDPPTFFTAKDNIQTADEIAPDFFPGEDETFIKRIFGPREPRIGDEADARNEANIAAYPNVASNFDLSIAPQDPLCNAAVGTPGRREADCLDVKPQGWIVAVKPGKEITPNNVAKIKEIRNAWVEYVDKYLTEDGRGARGKVGDADYLAKFDPTLYPFIH